MMTLVVFCRMVITGNPYWVLIYSLLSTLHTLVHLTFTVTLWGRLCYDLHLKIRVRQREVKPHTEGWIQAIWQEGQWTDCCTREASAERESKRAVGRLRSRRTWCYLEAEGRRAEEVRNDPPKPPFLSLNSIHLEWSSRRPWLSFG